MSGVELHTTIGALDVSEAYVRLLLQGNWMATCEIGWPDAPAVGSAAMLAITRSDGTRDTFTGTIRRAQNLVDAQRTSVTLVGGAGKLIDTIPPRHHASGASTIPAGLVLSGIVDATGSVGANTRAEVLAPGVLATTNAFPLLRWTRVQGEAWAAVENLSYTIGLSSPSPIHWRVLRDGTLWMGQESWPAVGARAFYCSGDPRDGMVLYAPDGAPYVPGTTIDGARVVECCYRIEPGKVRMEARMAMPGDPVRVPPLAAYARSYVCKSVVQHSDDRTLDLTGVDTTLGDDLRRIPFKLGIPGTRVEIPDGSLVRVSFENGLPNGAFAGDIDMDTTPTHRFALVDDDVDIGYLTATAPPGGGPVTLAISDIPAPPPALPLQLKGKISGPGHAYAYGKKAAS